MNKLLLVVLAALMVGGCASSNSTKAPGERAASGHAAVDAKVPHFDLPIQPLDARELGYAVQWPKTLALKRGDQLKHVVLAGDLILTIETPNNTLTATSFHTGETMWRVPVGSPLEILYPPFRVGDRVLVNSNRRMFNFRARDGKQLYVTNLDYPVSHPPAMLGEYAIFGGGGGRIFAHDIVTGFAKWQYTLPSEIKVSPVVSGQAVFAVDSTGVFAQLDGASGRLMWKGRAFAPVTAAPAIGNAIYLASHDQTLYALDRLSGGDRWKFRETEPLKHSPVVMAGSQYVFLPLGNRGLVAVDAATGKEVWRINEPATPVLIRGDRLMLNMGSALREVELNTGRTIQEIATKPLKTVLHDPESGSIVLVTPRGELQRIDPVR